MTFTVQEDVHLAEFTTLKIGGNARFFVRAQSQNETVEALKFATQNNLKVFILGGGSNVLISDTGFDGLVLQIGLKGISTVTGTGETVFVTARAGEDWDAFCEFCVAKNLQGVECLSGIPGFTGGTPVQNVGAYGQEVAESIASVRVLERASGRIFEMTSADCRFAYRSSVFNTTKKECFIVLSVTFALKQNGASKIVYKDLQNYFDGEKPNLRQTREAVLQIRRAKSMVIDERDPNSKSAGSFFKNPIVEKEQFTEIETGARRIGVIEPTENLPNFAVDENHLKIPAAWLIEKSGFQKGFRSGRVGLSAKHTLAIVNLGNATACDVLALKTEIQTKVKDKFDILLTPEPVFVGLKDS